jgi:phage-related baseplate assembly protein
MSNTLQSVFDLPDVSFIENDTLKAMMLRLVSNYEKRYKEVTGTSVSLPEGDPNRILLYTVALELYQIEMCVDRAGKQDLLKYSYGEFLDSLGANRGVVRQQPAAATTVLRFTISEAKDYAVGINQGVRVTNGNGIYFVTTEYGEVPIGALSVDIPATCTQTGPEGNGFVAGQLSIMADPIAYVEKVENTVESSGGTDLESDEDFAERIFLSPSSYSTAGPDDAYIYWAKTFSSDIGSVVPVSPEPCQVTVYVLQKDGTLPTETVLNSLQDFLQDKNIRPLTDMVTCAAPNIQPFEVDVTYYINRSDTAQASTIQSAVTEAVNDFVTWQRSEIGKDINPSELEYRIRAAGAKRAVIRSPTFTVVGDTEVAQPSGDINLIYGGLEDD